MLDTTSAQTTLLRPNEAENNSVSRPFLSIRNIDKRFGNFYALRDICLDIKDQEFICFLGPSGCGKSTLLRVIAGLEEQDAGTINNLGVDISRLPPAQRQCGILFQSYALFPNLNVRENIIYGLRSNRRKTDEIDSRLAELLDLIDLRGSENKYPAQLSGGQQQRVALARAIAPSPRLLLLDEPLSALDAKVRVHLRQQIRDLQKRLGLTTIMVTHDQEEALSMADRIVAMHQGEIEQIGTPAEIYHDPQTLFVADFVGKMNVLPGTVSGTRLTIGALNVAMPARYNAQDIQGGVLACIRPEQVRIAAQNGTTETPSLAATVTGLEFLGSFWRVTLTVPELGNANLAVDCTGRDIALNPMESGQTVHVVLPVQELSVFPAATPGKASGQ